ncbi:YIP1 family protein [Mesobaculum littorinae]|uniref:YIP1 family protein n=1 Tax=Mesobaculum littorinae TaxID=2486419 RepID=A0A438ALV7_9RHOB|nr:YIP1 family protein [Mesobaculum littorinae]RVV99821.1 YIP1 family protein [Mesobaculum littorinae]
MTLLGDILRSYRSPGRVLRRRMAGERREAAALATLMLGCALIYVAQWPRLARAAESDPGIDLQARLAGALLAWIFIAPLLFYGLAALSHLGARALGGRGSFFAARLALFWALLAAAPLWVLWGALSGLPGPGVLQDVVGIAALVAFFGIWGAGLAAVERRPAPETSGVSRT